MQAFLPLLHKRGHHSEKPMHHNEEELLIATTREKPLKKEAMKMQHKTKFSFFLIKKKVFKNALILLAKPKVAGLDVIYITPERQITL